MRSNLTTWIVLAFIAIATTLAVAAEDGAPYVDESKPFLEIQNVNRQAEAWAMCAASYNVMAELLFETQPARSQQLKELANGAKLL